MNKFSDCARNHYEKEFHENFNKAIKCGMTLIICIINHNH